MCDHASVQNYDIALFKSNFNIYDDIIDLSYYCKICNIYDHVMYTIPYSNYKYNKKRNDNDIVINYIKGIKKHLQGKENQTRPWSVISETIFKIVKYFKLSRVVHNSVCDKLKKYKEIVKQYKTIPVICNEYLKDSIINKNCEIMHDSEKVISKYVEISYNKETELKAMVYEIDKMIIDHSKFLIVYLEYHSPDLINEIVKLLEIYFAHKQVY